MDADDDVDVVVDVSEHSMALLDLAAEVVSVDQFAIANTFGQGIPAPQQRIRLRASLFVRLFVNVTSSCG